MVLIHKLQEKYRRLNLVSRDSTCDSTLKPTSQGSKTPKVVKIGTINDQKSLCSNLQFDFQNTTLEIQICSDCMKKISTQNPGKKGD